MLCMECPPQRRLAGDAGAERLGDLLVAARHGCPGAFDVLIAACRPLVESRARRHAWRPGDVDDIVQEVWTRLVEHAAAIREPRALLAWLAMVTTRVASELGRRDARLIPTDVDDGRAGTASSEDNAMRSFERREVTDGIRAALDRLDAADRRLLLLLDGDDSLSYRQVSEQVRRPIGSLGPTRRRLLRRLRVDPAVRRLLASD
jgi:RNA polymerase sigma factor (sigma-70 family)